MLISLLHVVKIFPSFKENLYQGASFRGYNLYEIKNKEKLYQLYSIPYKPKGGDFLYDSFSKWYSS